MDPIKVFLVEDERIVREGLRDMIPWEQYGFVFAGEAQDGEVALPMVRRIRPDILITDIKMPFMDGLSLSRLVNRELPDTRIIILSGYDDFEYAQQAIELQVDQYLLKPITKANAIKALEQTKKRIEEEQDQKEYLQTFTREARKYEDYSRRAFFEKLVSGALSVQEIYEQAEKLEIELDAESYNIVLFSIHTPGNVTGYSEGLSRMEETLLRYFIRIPDLLLFRSSLLSHAVLIKGSVEEALGSAALTLEEVKANAAGVLMVCNLQKHFDIHHLFTKEDALATFFASLVRSERFGEGTALGRANIIIYNYLKEAGAFKRNASGQYDLDYKNMEAALSGLTALVLKTQATGDETFARQFEAQYSKLNSDYDADRLNLGLEKIPADIRFNFK